MSLALLIPFRRQTHMDFILTLQANLGELHNTAILNLSGFKLKRYLNFNLIC